MAEIYDSTVGWFIGEVSGTPAARGSRLKFVTHELYKLTHNARQHLLKLVGGVRRATIVTGDHC